MKHTTKSYVTPSFGNELSKISTRIFRKGSRSHSELNKKLPNYTAKWELILATWFCHIYTEIVSMTIPRGFSFKTNSSNSSGMPAIFLSLLFSPTMDAWVTWRQLRADVPEQRSKKRSLQQAWVPQAQDMCFGCLWPDISLQRFNDYFQRKRNCILANGLACKGHHIHS